MFEWIQVLLGKKLSLQDRVRILERQQSELSKMCWDLKRKVDPAPLSAELGTAHITYIES